MSRSRQLLACLLALGVMTLVLPGISAAACGSGGGSAGDQQYVDPLAHCNHGSSSSSTTAAATTPATTPAATAATTTTPVATTSSAGKRTKSLPYTGFDLRWAAGFGLVLVFAGLGLRRAIQNF